MPRTRRSRKFDGRKLFRYREEGWMTQEELAEKSGLSRMTIYKLESGNQSYPTGYTIFALATTLGVRREDLLEDESGD